MDIGKRVKILSSSQLNMYGWDYVEELDQEFVNFEDGSAFTRDMEKFAGRTVTIVGYDYVDGIDGEVYFLDIDDGVNFWTKHMFDNGQI